MKKITNVNLHISEVKTYIPLQLQYIIGVYFLSLFFMMLYRNVIFFVHCFTKFSDINPILFLKSLGVGIFQDSIILGWTLAIFSLLMSLGAIFNVRKTWFYRPLHILLCFVLIIILFVTAIDAAYFTYLGNHINVIALSWIQSFSDIGKVFLRHPVYLLFFSAFLISVAWFIWLMYCLYNATLFKITAFKGKYVSIILTVTLSILITGLCCWGIRASSRPVNPISVSSAYFSDSYFFNQLSINPIFNLSKSMQEENFSDNKPLTIIDGITAKQTIDEAFILRNDKNYSYPKIPAASNIVFLLLQDVNNDDVNNTSMPYLSSLNNKSLSFTNVWPDGENEYNGIFSTLFAYPNLFSSNTMNTTIVPEMNGIATLLKHHKYTNIFYTTRNQRENSISRFLYKNDFNSVMSEGNSDVTKLINKLGSQPYSFFTCILINSNREDNHLKQTDKEIKQFITESQKHKWFKNTLFVISGTNGKEKIPLIMYMPSQFRNAKNNNLASQTDILPTVMTMIDEDYQNEDIFGLCIFANQRNYAISSYKHSVIVRDNKWKYVWRDSGKESLYYKGSDKKGVNYIKADYQQAEEMKRYGFSIIQFAQLKISQKKMNLR